MLRKILSGMLVLVLLAAFALPVVAVGEDEQLPAIFYDKEVEGTSQFLVKITRPEGDESTIYKTYLICGSALQDGLTVQLMVEDIDGSLEEYILNDDSGKSSWEVNAYSYFQKEVVLKEGANKIRVIVYKTGEAEKLVLEKNLQINNFTVTLLNQSLIDYLNRGIVRFGDMLKSFFGW